MDKIKQFLLEKRSTLDDDEVKERSWIVLFRKSPKLEVLLVKDEDGNWGFPGGQLNEEELPEDAAWRELKEETSVVPKDLHFWKTIYHDKEHKLKVSHIFYTEVSKDTKVKSASDVEKSKWYDVDEKLHLDGLSKPKKEAIEACSEKIKHPKKELDEALKLVHALKLPIKHLLVESKKRTNEGFLIVMEGIDGAGKSTQCRALRKFLEKKGWKVTTTEWNTSPYISKAIKKGKKENGYLLLYIHYSTPVIWFGDMRMLSNLL